MDFSFFNGEKNIEAHKKIQECMKKKLELSIQFYDDLQVRISCNKMARITYQLNHNSLKWLLTYVRTGEYDDFKVHPDNIATHVDDLQERLVKQLIEKGYNIKTMPFIRETKAHISLIGLFSYGKLFFRIRRSTTFMSYLASKGL